MLEHIVLVSKQRALKKRSNWIARVRERAHQTARTSFQWGRVREREKERQSTSERNKHKLILIHMRFEAYTQEKIFDFTEFYGCQRWKCVRLCKCGRHLLELLKIFLSVVFWLCWPRDGEREREREGERESEKREKSEKSVKSTWKRLCSG